jgi:hypothetical protein
MMSTKKVNASNMKTKEIRLGYKDVTVSVYSEHEILQAIEKEGLVDYAWGYKTPTCIWVFVDAQENEDVWKNITPAFTGVEPCYYYDSNELEFVNYYIIEKN